MLGKMHHRLLAFSREALDADIAVQVLLVRVWLEEAVGKKGGEKRRKRFQVNDCKKIDPDPFTRREGAGPWALGPTKVLAVNVDAYLEMQRLFGDEDGAMCSQAFRLAARSSEQRAYAPRKAKKKPPCRALSHSFLGARFGFRSGKVKLLSLIHI